MLELQQEDLALISFEQCLANTFQRSNSAGLSLLGLAKADVVQLLLNL